EAVCARHLHVEKGEVRVVVLNRLDCRRSVVAFGDEVEPRLGGNQPLEPLAAERLVVGDEDARPHRRRLGCHPATLVRAPAAARWKGMRSGTAGPSVPSENSIACWSP